MSLISEGVVYNAVELGVCGTGLGGSSSITLVTSVVVTLGVVTDDDGVGGQNKSPPSSTLNFGTTERVRYLDLVKLALILASSNESLM